MAGAGPRGQGLLVLGVDPGLTRCGLGVVRGRGARGAELVDVGVARTPADADLSVRLLAVHRAVGAWIDRHQPDVVAVERVFSQHNVRTVMGTAQAAGVALLAAAERDLPVALHTPSEVKAAVTGEGRADKAQVATMVRRILGLAEAPRPADAADALALAICHLWRGSASLSGGLRTTASGISGVAPAGATPAVGAATAAQRRWLEEMHKARQAGRAAPGPQSGRGAGGARTAPVRRSR